MTFTSSLPLMLVLLCLPTVWADDTGGQVLWEHSDPMSMGYYNDLVFSPDGAYVAYAQGYPGSIIVNRTDDWTQVATLSGFTSSIHGLSFTDNLIAGVDGTGYLMLFDATLGTTVGATSVSAYAISPPYYTAISPDGTMLALTCSGCTSGITLFSLPGLTYSSTLPVTGEARFAYLPDGVLAVLTITPRLELYDTNLMMMGNVDVLTGTVGTYVGALSVTWDGHQVAVAVVDSNSPNMNSYVKVYDISDRQMPPMLLKSIFLTGIVPPNPLVALNPFGGQLVTMVGNKVEVWDNATGAIIRALDDGTMANSYYAIQFSSNGLIATAEYNRIRIYAAFTSCRPAGPGRMVQFQCSKQQFIDVHGCTEDSCGNLQCPPGFTEAQAAALCPQNMPQYEQPQPQN